MFDSCEGLLERPIKSKKLTKPDFSKGVLNRASSGHRSGVLVVVVRPKKLAQRQLVTSKPRFHLKDLVEIYLFVMLRDFLFRGVMRRRK